MEYEFYTNWLAGTGFRQKRIGWNLTPGKDFCKPLSIDMRYLSIVNR